MVRPVPDEPIYRIDVTLQEIDPAVWRRLLLPGSTTLQRLHRILQVAMGWTDSHLYLFSVGEREYGLPDDCEDIDIRDARRWRLGQAAPSVGARFVYEYDMGDSWRHDVRVTAIRPPLPWERYPLCIAGGRACPPEDCGGTYGYAELLQALADRGDDEYESTLTWLGGVFDPADFDLAVTRGWKAPPAVADGVGSGEGAPGGNSPPAPQDSAPCTPSALAAPCCDQRVPVLRRSGRGV